MNRNNLLALSLALAFGSAAHAASNAPITDVTLYPDSATIGRTAHVTQGMTQLEITGLPGNFNTESIRVQADVGIHVGQVVTREERHTEAAGTQEAEINRKMQLLRDKEAMLNVDAKAANTVQLYLESFNRGGAEHPVATDGKALSTLAEAINHNSTEALARMEKVEEQKREIEAQINALLRELSDVRSGATDTRTIMIALNAHQAGSLHLSYLLYNAKWKPGYRASLDSSASKVDLERLATISQSSGEDWNNVALTLATGHPSSSPQVPDPTQWQLTYTKPEPPKPARASNAYGERRTESEAASPIQIIAAQDIKRSGYVDSEITELQNAYATQFIVPTRVTLPADGREIAVNLSAQSLAVKQAIRIVPKTDEGGVLTASAERPDGVWLSGHVQLFRDGNYVGVTQWHADDAGPLVFPFGRDDLIHVRVNHVQELSGSGGLLSQHNERHVADQYTVSNGHKSPIDVLVLESSPVSTSGEVHVQSTYLPKPTIDKWDDRNGIVAWQKTMAANEQMKISVDYDISYPKEGSMSGLP